MADHSCNPHGSRVHPAVLEGSTSPACDAWGEQWKGLAELVQTKPNHRNLPPDFRLQLQLLECSMQQRRLLEQVLDHQSRMAMRLENLSRSNEHLHQQLDQVNNCCQGLSRPQPKSPLREERPQQFRSEACTVPVGPVDGLDATCQSPAPAPKALPTEEKLHEEKKWEEGNGEGPNGEGPLADHHSSSHLHVPKLLRHLTRGVAELEEQPRLQRLFNGSGFDVLSAFVIILNSALVGWSANLSIAWQVDHVGGEELSMPTYLKYAGYGFIVFYFCEIVLKICAFGCGFFKTEHWRWNIFDLILVLCGIYEVSLDFTDALQAGGAGNVAWMRVLRVLRMTKMLRVVRIMRFFRVLRMMMSTIAGSMMTLLWSVTLLATLNFIFGLVFIQILASFLSETPANEVSVETLDSIKLYWGSVWQAIVTLYYAVTGGTDWEALAQPIRAAGEVYHLAFLFYVAFTVFSVVNVMTGLYVTSAEKVSKEDYQEVGAELAKRGETRKFIEFIRKVQEPIENDDPRDYIFFSSLEEHFESDVIQSFARIVELTLEDFRTVFTVLDIENSGKVLLSDFLDGCLKTNHASVSLDMLVLSSETLRCSRQQTRLMQMLQKRFDELTLSLTSDKDLRS